MAVEFRNSGVVTLLLVLAIPAVTVAQNNGQQKPRPTTPAKQPVKQPTIGKKVPVNKPMTEVKSPIGKTMPKAPVAAEKATEKQTQAAKSSSPSAEQALSLRPTQKDVEYDQPTGADVAKCSIKAEKIGNASGWVIRDAAGQILRNFVDTNGDNVVDQWSYYKDGLEVYRDVDSDFNGKADQCRWFNTAGTRWGVDRDEDGRIDAWKVISAEEVTAEMVAALRDRDPARFERLLLSTKELQSLGAGPELTAELTKKLAAASKNFRELLASQTAVTADTKWLYFGGSRPGVVPAGTDQSSGDLMVYENVAAMVETAGKPSQVTIGALVRVDDAWRMVDAPSEAEKTVFFHQSHTNLQPGDGPATGASEKERELIAKVEELGQKIAEASADEQIPLQSKLASVLEELVKASSNPQTRYQWQRQLIDMLAGVVQSGSDPQALARLTKLAQLLDARPEDAELAAHAHYALLLGEYTQSLQRANGEKEYQAIQEKWLADLEQYIKDYPKGPDLAEALMQLAYTYELAGADEKALKWYRELIQRVDDSPLKKKAEGAQRRLDSAGKAITLSGKDLSGKKVDLADSTYRGKLVLIHYWASNSDFCKRDLPLLKEMVEKYGSAGFAIIGVSCDNTQQELKEFLSETRVPWSQIFEEGGQDNRLATEMGILSLPTMILVDRQGKVLNRGIHAEELDSELKTILKPRVANNNNKK